MKRGQYTGWGSNAFAPGEEFLLKWGPLIALALAALLGIAVMVHCSPIGPDGIDACGVRSDG